MTTTTTNEQSGSSKPNLQWLHRLLSANPFYLFSALLLIYGVYRLSIDPHFLTEELSQLRFNFGALEVYELLLISTGVWLARRNLWYDATLLALLENLFIALPFILLSQAIFLGRPALYTAAGIAVALAIVRWTLLKRGFRELNLPNGLLAAGSVLLLLHLSLPLLMRSIHHEGDAVSGDIFRQTAIEHFWFLLMPGMVVLARLVPTPQHWGGHWPQRHWLPLGILTIWLASAGVHLVALGYVYDVSWNFTYLLPVLWAAGWMGRARLRDLTPEPTATARERFLYVPFALLLTGAFFNATDMVFTLSMLNTALLVYVWRREGKTNVVKYLAYASIFCALAALPLAWVQMLRPDIQRRDLLTAISILFLLWKTIPSKRPELGVVAMFAVGVVAFELSRDINQQAWITFQAISVSGLLHSLRWNDSQDLGVRALRGILAISWTIHTIAWVNQSGGLAFWQAHLGMVALASGYLLHRVLTGHWGAASLPLACGLVVLSSPAIKLIAFMKTAPVGLLAMFGSLGLFALGTIAAITRSKWEKYLPHAPVNVPTSNQSETISSGE